MFLFMEQGDLFPDPRPALSDEEIATVLRAAIARGGRLPRTAELWLSSLCAEFLVAELRNAGLDVVRRPMMRLRD